MKLENLLFGDYSKRALKKIEPAVKAVDGLAETYRTKTDAELAATTEILKKRDADG